MTGEGIELSTKGCFRDRVWPEREFKGQAEGILPERTGDTQPQPTLFKISAEGVNLPQRWTDGISG